MRTSAAVATVLAVTGAALAWAPTASAAGPECAAGPLGTAGLYAEFVERDSVRHSDSEGAVAVGGDATFGSANRSGFSVGSRLTDTDLAELPGGHSLVVGGTLKANGVVLVKGSGTAGKVVDASAGDGGFAVDGPIAEGPSPVDFGKEFANLRTLSAGWAGERPNGETAGGQDGRSLYLTGTDAELNVFALSTADLEKAGEIYLKVPVGSSTLVNVIGASYDMSAKPTSGVWISEGGPYVQDDYDRHTDGHKSIRSKLLWNFPQAETVRKNSSAWPGAILAPRAAVTMTSGHINGSVIAESLDTAPGAETHRMNFTGCLPRVTTPGPVVTPETPKPTDTPAPTTTPSTTTPSTTAPAPQETGTPTGQPSSTPSGAPSGTPAESTAPPAAPEETGAAPAPSATTPEGDLATTGSAIGPGVIGAAVGALLLGGGFLAFAKRRRRA